MSKMIDEQGGQQGQQQDQQQQDQDQGGQQGQQQYENPNFGANDEGDQGGWLLDNEPEPVAPAAPAQGGQGQDQQRGQQGQGQDFQQRGQGADQGGGQQAGQGYQVQSRFGHVFRGANPEEVAQQLLTYFDRAMYANTQLQQDDRGGRGYQDQQQQRGQGQGQGQRQQRGRAPSLPQDEKFDPNQFFTYLKDSKVIDAMDYALRHYFETDDPRAVLHDSYSTALRSRDSMETADFLANNNDFPNTNEASTVILQRLDRDSVPLTRWNLEVAFNQLVREGVLQRTQPQQRGQRQDNGGNGNGNGNGYRNDYRQQGQGPIFSDQGQQEQGQQSRNQSRRQEQGQQGGQQQTTRRRAPQSPPTNRQSAEQDFSRSITESEFDNLSSDDQKKYLRQRGFNV